MRNRTPLRFSRPERDMALQTIPEGKHSSCHVKKPMEPKRSNERRQTMTTTTPMKRVQSSPNLNQPRKTTQGQKKKSTIPRHFSTETKTRRQATSPSRPRPRCATPTKSRPHPLTRVPSSPSKAETIPILKKQGSLLKSASYEGPILPSKSLRSEKPILNENNSTAFLTPQTCHAAHLNTQMLSSLFCGVHKWIGAGTLNSETQTVNPVQQADQSEQQGQTSAPTHKELERILSLGRSISLPFFGQTEPNTNNEETAVATTVKRAPMSFGVFPTIPEVRSEEEEESNIIKSLSFNITEAAMNLGNSWKVESSTNPIAESRDEEQVQCPVAAPGSEPDETNKAVDSVPETSKVKEPVKETNQAGEPVQETKKAGEPLAQKTKKVVHGVDTKKKETLRAVERVDTKRKEALRLVDPADTKIKEALRFRKTRTHLDDSIPDLSAMEIRQVTSLVMDLAREESCRREASVHPTRVVRVSSKADGWKKRLKGGKNHSKSGYSNQFASKKRSPV